MTSAPWTPRGAASRRARTAGCPPGSPARRSSRRRRGPRRPGSSRGSRCRRAGRPGSGPGARAPTAANASGEPELDRRGDPQRLADRLVARLPVGDRAREQLLDRPEEDRDRHEDGRPQDDDLAVGRPLEVVRGEREVDVGQEPRRPDARPTASPRSARSASSPPPLPRAPCAGTVPAPGAHERSSGSGAYDWLTDQSIGRPRTWPQTRIGIHLRRALELAAGGHGRVSPNPMVGAVLVRDGQVIGEGFHAELGGPHAEVAAIEDSRARGIDPAGATLLRDARAVRAPRPPAAVRRRDPATPASHGW